MTARRLAGLLALAALPLHAAPKTNGTYDVNADLAGVSGSVGASNLDGLQVDATFGWLSSGSALVNDSLAVLPGIWGVDVPPQTHVNALSTPCGGATLQIPSSAAPTDYFLRAAASPADQPSWTAPALLTNANKSLTQGPYRFAAPADRQICEVSLTAADGTPLNGVPATIAFPYADADGNDLLDPPLPALRVNSLAIWGLDASSGKWVELPSTPNPSLKTVSASVGTYSVFALVGAPNFGAQEPFAFPVPWRPHGGSTALGITFTKLPSPCRIRIYTLAGGLVKEIIPDPAAPAHTWDVRNGDGQDVATGTYIYVIESEKGSRRRGKLVIVR